MRREKKRARPLLIATVGVSALVFAGGCFTSGNLMAIRCDPPRVYTAEGICTEPSDAGVSDGGVTGGDQ